MIWIFTKPGNVFQAIGNNYQTTSEWPQLGDHAGHVFTEIKVNKSKKNQFILNWENIFFHWELPLRFSFGKLTVLVSQEKTKYHHKNDLWEGVRSASWALSRSQSENCRFIARHTRGDKFRQNRIPRLKNNVANLTARLRDYLLDQDNVIRTYNLVNGVSRSSLVRLWYTYKNSITPSEPRGS